MRPEEKLEQEMATSIVTGSGTFKPDAEYMRKHGACYLERTTLYAVLVEMKSLRARLAQCESDLQVAAKHERLAVDGFKEWLALAEAMAEAIEETENAWEKGWDPSRVEAHRLFCEKLAQVFEALAAWRGAK